MFYWLLLDAFFYFTAQSWCSVVRTASSISPTIIYFSKRSLEGALDIHIYFLHKRNYQMSSSREEVQANKVKYIYLFSLISTSIFSIHILGQCWPGWRNTNLKKGWVIFSSQILYILKSMLTSEFNQLVPVGIFTLLFLRMLPKVASHVPLKGMGLCKIRLCILDNQMNTWKTFSGFIKCPHE